MLHISAPGKFMISGEWSVLEAGNPCVAAAISQRVHCEIEILEKQQSWIYPIVKISLDDYKIKDKLCKWDGKKIVLPTDIKDEEKDRLKFVVAAAESALSYLESKKAQIKNVSLRTWSDQAEVAGEKLGFGGSAAITVATIAALFEQHGSHIETYKSEIYKLAMIAHWLAQGKVGSGFDVSVSTYGGLVHYVAPDKNWLSKKLGMPIEKLVAENWPMLKIESLKVPDDIYLAVAYTGKGASTPDLIKKMDAFKQRDRETYMTIIEAISEVTEKLIKEIKEKHHDRILELIRKNRKLLTELTKESLVPIETPQLANLADIADKMGAAGKLSGAGGGDCGIGVCFDEELVDGLKIVWKDAGLKPLDVELDREGARTEK